MSGGELDEDALIDVIDASRLSPAEIKARKDREKAINSKNLFKRPYAEIKEENFQADQKDRVASAKLINSQPLTKQRLEDCIADLLHRMNKGPKQLPGISRQNQARSDKLFSRAWPPLLQSALALYLNKHQPVNKNLVNEALNSLKRYEAH